MGPTIGNLVEPATSLLARLVSGIPGMLIPGLLILTACLCAFVLVDLMLDRAGVAASLRR